MPLAINVTDLLAYTNWQHNKWDAFLTQHKDGLQRSAGPNGDGRFSTVGDLIRHVFSAEKRYVERLSNRPLTDATTIPNNDVEALFSFGRRGRQELMEFIESFPDANWDIVEEHTILGHKVRLTPRKIVVHVVLHEIRHWAQIATLLRLEGMKTDFQDFLGSPVFGDPHV